MSLASGMTAIGRQLERLDATSIAKECCEKKSWRPLGRQLFPPDGGQLAGNSILSS